MNTLLTQRLAESARLHDQKPAVTYRERTRSYQALWNDAQHVAAYLQSRGITPGDRVALVMQNSPEYIAIYYGIWLTGGIAVALNPQAAVADIRNWIGFSEAKALFLDAAYQQAQELTQSLDNVNTVTVDTANGTTEGNWGTVLSTPPDKEFAKLDPNKPAAIIFTSGTTGSPKGVTLSHANLSANTDSILEYLGLSADDSIVNVLPFFYSYGNSVLHTHLAVGATLHLENSLAYPHQVMEKVANLRATGFAGVPSTYALLLSRVDLGKYDLSKVRYMTQAGGPMSVAHIERLQATIPAVQLFVMYGQTEASARLTYLPPDMLDKKRGSAGRAIPGVTLEIRDDSGANVPCDTCGEIYAYGGNVMLGYWNNPDATRTVLIDGWLKTGDLGRMDGDGYLFIEGRSSDIIKTGAFRVSPQEIEEVIQELPEVAEVAAVGIPDELMGELIKAVVVLKPQCTIVARDIQAHCRRRLPLYKVPKLVEFADELPKVSSGKIKRAALVSQQKEKS